MAKNYNLFFPMNSIDSSDGLSHRPITMVVHLATTPFLEKRIASVAYRIPSWSVM
jgi:hypothetical protein